MSRKFKLKVMSLILSVASVPVFNGFGAYGAANNFSGNGRDQIETPHQRTGDYVIRNNDGNGNDNDRDDDNQDVPRRNVPGRVVSLPTPLHEAVERGDRNEVEMLLAAGADPNVLFVEDTPLHIAASAGNLDLVRILVEHGAIGDLVGDDEWTVLHEAVRSSNRNCAVVEYLLNNREMLNIDINAQSVQGESTALTLACSEGSLEIVRCLIRHGADANLRDDNGTPLTAAAVNGHINVVTYLIDEVNVQYREDCLLELFGLHSDAVEYFIRHHLSDVNLHYGDLSETPLHYAARAGKLDLVEYLVSRGANVNATDNIGKTPLHYAARAGKLDLVEYLVSRGANVNAVDNGGDAPLHYAAKDGKLEIVKYLVDRGANVNETDSFGVTPLCCAAKAGKLDLVEYLVSRGANVNAVDNDGDTPLGYAAMFGNVEVVKYLIDHGANTLVSNRKGKTMLHCAVVSGNAKVVKYLIDYGADVNAVDNNYETPLYAAVRVGYLGVIDCLLRNGASASWENLSRETPLHVAVWGTLFSRSDISEFGAGRFTRLEIVKRLTPFLSDHGQLDSNFNIRNNKGKTILHLAVKTGDLDVVQYLVETCHADVNVLDNDNETPLYDAIREGRPNVVVYLLNHGATVRRRNSSGETPLHIAVAHASGGARSPFPRLFVGGFLRPNQGFLRPNQGFLRPNQGFLRPNLGFLFPNQGEYVDGEEVVRRLVEFLRNNGLFDIVLNMRDNISRTPLDIARGGPVYNYLRSFSESGVVPPSPKRARHQ